MRNGKFQGCVKNVTKVVEVGRIQIKPKKIGRTGDIMGIAETFSLYAI